MATADEQIAAMAERANAVAVATDILRRARRGEIRHLVFAAELVATDKGEPMHATVHSTFHAGDRLKLIGLVQMALDRLVRGP